MIHVTRLNRISVVLNCDLIEHIEATPDTVISLTTGQKIVVLESPEEIIERVVEFRRRLISKMPIPPSESNGVDYNVPSKDESHVG